MPEVQLRSLLGDHGDWELGKFKSEDISGFKINVEAGSLRPRSALTEQAQVEQAIERGLINPMDPYIKSELLRNMGLSRYDLQTDWDLKDAAREEESFVQITAISEVPDEQLVAGALRFRPLIDNHLHSYGES